ncbi:hypothetical protein CP10139811_1072, partial [Chlamydia ibidis]
RKTPHLTKTHTFSLPKSPI